MKRTIRITAIAVLLFVIGSAGAVAAPLATAAAASGSAGSDLPAVLFQANRAQQDVIAQWEAARLQQMLALVRAGQPAEVEFAGTLQPAGGAGRWSVAGFPLSQSGATVFAGTPAAGLHAHVRAQIHSNGTVEALHVQTLTHTAQTAAWQHTREWLQDDHGVHVGGCQTPPAGDHTAEHRVAQTWQHEADPEHPAPVTTPQPAPPPHHPETPVQHPGQPQPVAPQPEQHHGDASDGSHDSGHRSGHD